MSETSIITLSGNTSELEARFFPTIELDVNKNYALGLVEFLSYNSVPNIYQGLNEFQVQSEKTIYIPTGSYEIEDIEKYIKSQLKGKGITISIKANNNTLQSAIRCDREIDLTSKNSIGKVLGFKPQILTANKLHISDLPVSILKANVIRIECNITRGAYFNSEKVHTIHEFFPSVAPGYKIIEKPSSIIYLPISDNKISHLQVRIIDQDGDLINFRGEEITIRLHIKTT